MVGCDDEVVVYKPNKKHTNYQEHQRISAVSTINSITVDKDGW
jgi:hypothetical protein